MLKIKKKEIQIIFMLLLAGGIIYFISKIKSILVPFILGIILAYLLYPLISFLKKRKFSRVGAIYVLIIIFLLISLFIGLVLFPLFLEELEVLTIMVPKYINTLERYWSVANQEYKRVQLPAIIKEVVNRTLNKMETRIILSIQNFTETIINSLSYLFSILISPIIAFYILKDLKDIKKSFLKIIPKNKRRLFLLLGREIGNIFVGYLRGLIWVSIVVAFLTSLGLYTFKIQFFLILGIFSGITNMIPYIGPVIGGIPAVFIALNSSFLKALAVFLLYVLIQQIESSIIGPKIISERVGLHPLTIIFVLLTGAELFGIWGLIFAVPFAGSIKVIIRVVGSYVDKRYDF